MWWKARGFIVWSGGGLGVDTDSVVVVVVRSVIADLCPYITQNESIESCPHDGDL